MKRSSCVVLAAGLFFVLAAPVAGQMQRGQQQCQACIAPVARLGFRFSADWNEDDQGRAWTETLSVVEILEDTPAEAAGLRAGDVILSVNELVATSQLFWSLRRTIQPGDAIRLRIRRDGQERELRLVAVREDPS